MKYIKMLANDDYMDNVDLWEAFDEIAEELGTEEFLNALAKSMGNEELRENMQYIIRAYDLANDTEE